MAAAPSASCCWAPTMCTRAPPTRSCAPSCTPRASRTATSTRSTPRSAIPTTRPSSPTSRSAAAGGKTAVISTINGDSNVPLYKELGNAGLKATDVPVVKCSAGEEELRGVDTKPLAGPPGRLELLRVDQEPGQRGIYQEVEGLRQGQEPAQRQHRGHQRPDGSHLHRHPHVEAGSRAGHITDVDKVIAAMGGQKFNSPSGFTIEMDKTNRSPAQAGLYRQIKADGQFNVVWKSKALIRAQPWSPYIPGNESKASLTRNRKRSHAQCGHREILRHLLLAWLLAAPALAAQRPRLAWTRRCWRPWPATTPTPVAAIAALGRQPARRQCCKPWATINCMCCWMAAC